MQVDWLWQAMLTQLLQLRQVLYPIMTDPGWVTVFALVVTWLQPAYCPRRRKVHDSPRHGLPGETVRVCVQLHKPAGSKAAFSVHQGSTELEAWLRFAGVPHVLAQGSTFWSPKGELPYVQHGKDIFGSLPIILDFFQRNYFEEGGRMGAVRRGRGAVMDSAQHFRAGEDDPAVPLLLPDAQLSGAQRALSAGLTALVRGPLHAARLQRAVASPASWRAHCRRAFPHVPAWQAPFVLPWKKAALQQWLWTEGTGQLCEADLCCVSGSALDALEAALATAMTASEASGTPWFTHGAAPSAVDAALFAYFDCVLCAGGKCFEKTKLRTLPACMAFHSQIKAMLF